MGMEDGQGKPITERKKKQQKTKKEEERIDGGKK